MLSLLHKITIEWTSVLASNDASMSHDEYIDSRSKRYSIYQLELQVWTYLDSQLDFMCNYSSKLRAQECYLLSLGMDLSHKDNFKKHWADITSAKDVQELCHFNSLASPKNTRIFIDKES